MARHAWPIECDRCQYHSRYRARAGPSWQFSPRLWLGQIFRPHQSRPNRRCHSRDIPYDANLPKELALLFYFRGRPRETVSGCFLESSGGKVRLDPAQIAQRPRLGFGLLHRRRHVRGGRVRDDRDRGAPGPLAARSGLPATGATTVAVGTGYRVTGVRRMFLTHRVTREDA